MLPRPLLLCLVVVVFPAAETKTTRVLQVSKDPRLYAVRGFATDAEMNHMMKEAWDRGMEPQAANTETGIRVEYHIRDDPIMNRLYKRMGDVFPDANFPTAAEDSFPTFRIRRYLPDGIAREGGDYHPPHTDFYSRSDGYTLVLSLMLYLSTPEVGGQTRFKYSNQGAGFEFEPIRGDLAVWWSCTRDAEQDHESEHSSEPLLRGIKWNAVRFIYVNDTKRVCALDAAHEIEVPDEVDNNQYVPTEDVLYGTQYPPGIQASSQGTSRTAPKKAAKAGVDMDELKGKVTAASEEVEDARTRISKHDTKLDTIQTRKEALDIAAGETEVRLGENQATLIFDEGEEAGPGGAKERHEKDRRFSDVTWHDEDVL